MRSASDTERTEHSAEDDFRWWHKANDSIPSIGTHTSGAESAMATLPAPGPRRALQSGGAGSQSSDLRIYSIISLGNVHQSSLSAAAISQRILDAVSSGHLTTALRTNGMIGATASGLAKLTVVTYSNDTSSPRPEIRAVSVPTVMFTAAGVEGTLSVHAEHERTNQPQSFIFISSISRAFIKISTAVSSRCCRHFFFFFFSSLSACRRRRRRTRRICCQCFPPQRYQCNASLVRSMRLHDDGRRHLLTIHAIVRTRIRDSSICSSVG